MAENKSPKKELSSIDQIMLGAKNEINEEICKKYREQVKVKLRDLAHAKRLVKNLEREILDIEIRIAEELE